MIEKLAHLVHEGEQRLYPNRPMITVGMGTCGIGSGADVLYEGFASYIEKHNLPILLRSVGCFGFCSEEPLVMLYLPSHPLVVYSRVESADVPFLADNLNEGRFWRERILCKISAWDHHLTSHLYGEGLSELKEWNELPFFHSQTKLILRDAGIIDPDSIEEYAAVGGYRSFASLVGVMSREEVLSVIKDSHLRGRGGAGFPTGLKWELMAKEEADRKFIICNADEGDPGAYMNRNEMESDPHMVIEGMLIGAYATGAKEGIIYVRAEYPLAVERLKRAISQAYEHHLLGEHILDSHLSFNLSVVEGAGAFVCGEETALIASLEGKAGRSTAKPPFPSQRGYLGCPTTINNLETWCNIPLVIGKGSNWFQRIGTPKSPGTKVFSLVGKVKHTGLVELALGEKLTTLVYEAGGGSVQSTKHIKAVQSGGPSGGCIPSSLFDTPIDYENLTKLGAIMGSGGMVVMDNDNCMVDSARYFLEFTTKESCGKCTPCREGLSQALQILNCITTQQGRMEDLSLLSELCTHISDTSLCGLGQSAMNPVATTLRYFRSEYEEHILQKHCEAGTCEAMVSELCSNSCPLGMRIPTYIALLRENRLVEAFTSTLEDNPLPGTLGRICHFHCQMRCRRESLDNPVHQGELHRYLADTLYKMGQEQDVYQDIQRRMAKPTGKRISIVGSGPAGLSAAFSLSRLGHEVIIYEQEKEAGGVLRYGIPDYRLPKDVLDKELELFGLLGVKFAFSTTLGKDLRLEELKSSSDAVILALGSYHHAPLVIPGSEGTGVVQGTEVLKRLAVNEPDQIGKRVVVIGGGNVAIDVARSLWRLDKDVVIAYRREMEEMPANRSEIEEAQAEGLSFCFNVAPTEIIRDAKKNVIALRCEHLLPKDYDLSGRRKRSGTSTYEDLACDTVIIAVGERVDANLLASEGLSVTQSGQLAAERHSFLTSKANVWAIGDVITGPSTAAEAMGHGKEVAKLIDRCLTGEERFSKLFSSFTYDKSIAKTLHEGKAIQAEKLELSQRQHSFAEVNKGYSGRQARMEAGRCLRCDIHLEEVLNGQQPSARNN